MFLDNKYRSWYYSLCSKSATSKHTHRHHIIPKSLGGTDDPSNLVDLTFRQHFVAHRLLLKITTGVAKSKMAFAMMRFGKNSRSYERASKQISEALSGVGNPMFGRKLSPEHKRAITGEKHGMYGKGCYDVWVKKYGIEIANKLREEMSQKRSKSLTGSNNGMFGKKHSAERNAAHSASLTGRKYMWKDGKQKRIRPENIEAMLAEGWSLTKSYQKSHS